MYVFFYNMRTLCAHSLKLSGLPAYIKTYTQMTRHHSRNVFGICIACCFAQLYLCVCGLGFLDIDL
jgi:hypothetical protein